MDKLKKYPAFAKLFQYPGKNYYTHAKKCIDLIRENYPEAVDELIKFTDYLRDADTIEREEVFTRTFHIQAICYLDIGYVLFGEDYKRGEFLVNMKREQEAVGNDCGDELPDNLANILTLLPKIKDKEFLSEFTVRLLIPALDKMLAEFDSARLALKVKIMKKKHKALIREELNDGNPYRNVITALQKMLEADFKGIDYKEPEDQKPAFSSTFITGCSTCSIAPSTNNNNANINSKRTLP